MAVAEPIEFESMSAAFAHCREVNRPVLVRVEDEIGTVYPSGHFRPCKEVPND